LTEPAEIGALRLDKWLCHARFIKARDLAAGLVAERRVRLNDQVVAKTHQLVRPGDVLTLRQGERLRVLRVVGLGRRRGPAAEARLLYEELLCES
jgi:ribosome-associated heat shock protein Hsp15